LNVSPGIVVLGGDHDEQLEAASRPSCRATSSERAFWTDLSPVRPPFSVRIVAEKCVPWRSDSVEVARSQSTTDQATAMDVSEVGVPTRTGSESAVRVYP